MAEVLRVLGQVNPVADELTTLYQATDIEFCTVSTVVVCNQTPDVGAFKLAISVGGESEHPKQFLYFNQLLDGNSTFMVTIGMTLSVEDSILVEANSSSFSFCAFGVEVK
jgi:hypothetical protein